MDAAVIDDYLREAARADRFSGVVGIEAVPPTSPPGTDAELLLHQAYGWASRTWRVPCEVTTRFDTASTTKLFTAVAALQQVEAGAFGLQTSVVDYVGVSALLSHYPVQGVTVAMLSNMHDGVWDPVKYLEGAWDLLNRG